MINVKHCWCTIQNRDANVWERSNAKWKIESRKLELKFSDELFECTGMNVMFALNVPMCWCVCPSQLNIYTLMMCTIGLTLTLNRFNAKITFDYVNMREKSVLKKASNAWYLVHNTKSSDIIGSFAHFFNVWVQYDVLSPHSYRQSHKNELLIELFVCACVSASDAHFKTLFELCTGIAHWNLAAYQIA